MIDESEQKSIIEYFGNTNKMKYKGIKITPFNSDKPDKILIKKLNKKSIYCEATEDCMIYDFKLQRNKKYKIELEIFDRSSKWTEFVALKNQFVNNKDRRQESYGICI